MHRKIQFGALWKLSELLKIIFLYLRKMYTKEWTEMTSETKDYFEIRRETFCSIVEKLALESIVSEKLVTIFLLHDQNEQLCESFSFVGNLLKRKAFKKQSIRHSKRTKVDCTFRAKKCEWNSRKKTNLLRNKEWEHFIAKCLLLFSLRSSV